MVQDWIKADAVVVDAEDDVDDELEGGSFLLEEEEEG